MRLQRIMLENYRGVRRSEVEFGPDGVTVVHGPNEIGKSSLVEALDLMLRFPATTSHRDVQAVRPSGRDEDPVTEIELQAGPHRVRYRKLWRKGSGKTELHVLEPADAQAQYTGGEAQAAFEALLARAGVDLDLWKLLRVNQDKPLGRESKEEPLGQPTTFAKLPAVAAALAGAQQDQGTEGGPGGAGVGPDGASGPQERLFAAVQREYRLYFTPETGKPTGAYRKAIEELEDANTKEAAAKQALADAQDTLAAHARTTSELAHEQEELDELGADVAGLKARLAEAAGIQERQRALALRLDLARQHADAQLERTQRAAKLDEELAAQKDAAEQARLAAQSYEAKQQELTRLDEGGVPLAEARQLAEQDVACLRDQETLARLDDAVQAAAEAAERLAAANAELAVNKLDKDTLTQVSEAFQAWDKAASALDAHAATVQIERLGDAPVEVSGAASAAAGPASATAAADGSTQLGLGQLSDNKLLDTVTVTSPGVVRVVVSPGSGEAARREKARSTRAAYEAACREAGVADLATARAAADAHDDAVSKRDLAATELRAALSGVKAHGADLPTLRSAAASLRTSLTAHLERRPPAAPALPASAEAAAERLAEARVAVAENDARLKTAGLQAAAADKEAGRLRERLSSLERAVENAQEEVKRAQAAIDRLPVGETAEQLDRARAAHEQSASRLAELNPSQLESVLDNKTRVRAQLEADFQDRRMKDAALRTTIAAYGELGPQETAERALSRVAQAQHAFYVLQERAEAARLLRDTLAKHRSEQRARYAAPFRALVEQYAEAVFGSDVSLQVGEDLTIVSKSARGETVPFNSLSTGAREQLALLGRIACAQLVAPGTGGVPLILDDTLGHSDRRRIDNIAAILDRVAGTGMQVIVLTHAPERFRIGSATRVDLAAA